MRPTKMEDPPWVALKLQVALAGQFTGLDSQLTEIQDSFSILLTM